MAKACGCFHLYTCPNCRTPVRYRATDAWADSLAKEYDELCEAQFLLECEAQKRMEERAMEYEKDNSPK